MDLSCGRMPYNRRQYRGHNAYTNTAKAQQEYSDAYNNATTTEPQQDYRHPQPKGPCFNCRKPGHFVRDCCSNPFSNISYMDSIEEDMWNIPQPSITPRTNVAHLKAQIDSLSAEDNM
jgi:Zinc knuckle